MGFQKETKTCQIKTYLPLPKELEIKLITFLNIEISVAHKTLQQNSRNDNLFNSVSLPPGITSPFMEALCCAPNTPTH